MRDPVWNKIIGFFLATGAFYVTLKVDPPPPTVIFCTCFLTDALAAVARYHGGILLGFAAAIAGVCLWPIHILLGAQ